MQSLTYTFPGPLTKPPIIGQQGDPVVCQLAPQYANLSTNGTPYVLGNIASIAHSGQTWSYVVVILDNKLITGAVAAGKFLGSLSGFNAPERLMLATKQTTTILWHQEAWGPIESIGNETRWLGNPDISGVITGIRVSLDAKGTPSTGKMTANLVLNGQPLTAAPIQFSGLTCRVAVSKRIIAGQRLSITTTGQPVSVYSQRSTGLQVELTLSLPVVLP